MKKLIEELTVEIDRLRSDIAMMETGAFKLSLNDQDITTEWMQRQKRVARHLDQLLQSYRQDDA